MLVAKVQKPRCYLVYAVAPDGVSAAEANRLVNGLVEEPGLPLVLFHDHFIKGPGGLAIFFVESPEQVDAIAKASEKILSGWAVEIRPLIFSYNPGAFDEQIAYTLKTYRGQDWHVLREEDRPSYGDPVREALTGEED